MIDTGLAIDLSISILLQEIIIPILTREKK